MPSHYPLAYGKQASRKNGEILNKSALNFIGTTLASILAFVSVHQAAEQTDNLALTFVLGYVVLSIFGLLLAINSASQNGRCFVSNLLRLSVWNSLSAALSLTCFYALLIRWHSISAFHYIVPAFLYSLLLWSLNPQKHTTASTTQERHKYENRLAGFSLFVVFFVGSVLNYTNQKSEITATSVWKSKRDNIIFHASQAETLGKQPLDYPVIFFDGPDPLLLYLNSHNLARIALYGEHLENSEIQQLLRIHKQLFVVGYHPAILGLRFKLEQNYLDIQPKDTILLKGIFKDNIVMNVNDCNAISSRCENLDVLDPNIQSALKFEATFENDNLELTFLESRKHIMLCHSTCESGWLLGRDTFLALSGNEIALAPFGDRFRDFNLELIDTSGATILGRLRPKKAYGK